MPLSPLMALASLCLSVCTAAPTTDRGPDLAAARDFLAKDKSYSPAERLRAEAALARIEAEAARMTDAQFELALAHIAAMTDNGHSFLLVGSWTQRYNRLPIRFLVLADGLFVAGADPAHAALIGQRVEAIDGRSWPDLRKRYAFYQGGKEEWREQSIRFFLESPQILNAAGLAPRPSTMRLRLRAANGTMSIHTLEAKRDPEAAQGNDLLLPPDRLIQLARSGSSIFRGPMPLYLQQPDHQFRSLKLPEHQAYYLQLQNNVDWDGEKLAPFVANVRTEITALRPKFAIVDLRFDQGGDLNLTRQLMQDLPSLIAPGGRIYAITSGRTFSAGISSLGYLKQAGGARVTIVGSQIGDRLSFWAETDTVDLPQTGASILYATERHDYRTGCPESDCHASIRNHPIRVTSLDPDLPAALTSKDVKAGRDPAMEAILRDMARRR